jgi:transposase
METKNKTPTLFDTISETPQKPTGNPYHARSGKFTNKYIARAEQAEKRAAIAENRLEYVTSCYSAIGRQFARVSRELEQAKQELKQLKNQRAWT